MELAKLPNKKLNLPLEWDPNPQSLDPHKQLVAAQRKKARNSANIPLREAPYFFDDLLTEFLLLPFVTPKEELDAMAMSEAQLLAKTIGIDLVDIPGLTGIPPECFGKNRRKLNKYEFNILIRLNRYLEEAKVVFRGNTHSVVKWIREQSDELGGKSPLRTATSEEDFKTVNQYLRKILHDQSCEISRYSRTSQEVSL